MEISDLSKEIQSLKKKISELESKINNNSSLAAFGRSYSKAGSTDSDFLIQTKGQVKIQWGSKFIDLIKDGEINIDSKFIYKENQVGVKDGIYVIEGENDSSVILKVGNSEINLKGDLGNTYVSFQTEQNTTPQQKYTALTNIGFIYKNIADVDNTSLQNGIIYIESSQKLYIVQNGIISEFFAKFPNPYKDQFIIQKSNDDKGSIVIIGSGIENSIAFDSFYIYTSNNEVFLKSNGSIYFNISEQNKVVIGLDETIFNNQVSSQMFKSNRATDTSGFRLYMKDNQSTLEVDNLIIRNNQDSEDFTQLYPITWYYKSNIITSVENSIESESQQIILNLRFAYKNEFEVGQKVYTYLPVKESGVYNQILLPLNIEKINTQEDQTTISVTIIKSLIDSSIIESFDIYNIVNQLKGQEIFLISVDNGSVALIRKQQNNIDLLEVNELQQALENKKIVTRIGNIEELELYTKENNSEKLIIGYGTYSINSYFLNAQYIKDYKLPIEDNSTKFVSTEWIHKIFPKGTILMLNGTLSPIPEGWVICDGNNDTPNLIDKFIKKENMDSSEELANIEPQNYSLIFIMKIV